MKEENQLVIFEDSDKKVEVQLREETIWLNLNQISQLFDKDKSVISRHIKNIFRTGELDKNSTVAKFATVQLEGKRKVKRTIEYFNLDVIISVGYRVNSKKATQFRIWATNVLKNYLVKGYAINEKKLTEEKLKELEEAIKFIKENINTPSITASEEKGMLEIIEKYALVWKWVEEYDTGKIEARITRKERKKISYQEAKEAIVELKNYLIERKEASDIFGIERDRGLFESALNTIYQSFGGEELYPSFEEKAANLLYLIIKNYPFVDGNKRIGALLFLKFLYENLSKEELFQKFNSNTLTALCYLVAASPAEQKEQLIKLIMNFIAFEG
ncbi:Fic family protein [Nitratiruptor sp. SB155-2]|uniref:Fic family protein n=1 Tax=Nitratiruptor sp. (strain SB155-2) TaxID=387092 RepID=UPI0001586FEC|nr:Fic family protein [Nitratiruptor sp. SB155-2]BAF70812.1 death-on-curing family protein [Nitratiruptor sp. SB155-2]